MDEADPELVWCSLLKPLLTSIQTCPYVLGAKSPSSQWEQVADLWLLGAQGMGPGVCVNEHLFYGVLCL